MENNFEEVTSAVRTFATYPDEEFVKYLNDELNLSRKLGGNGLIIKSLYKKELIKNEPENRLYQLSEYILNHKSVPELGGYEVKEHAPIGLYRTIDIYKI